MVDFTGTITGVYTTRGAFFVLKSDDTGVIWGGANFGGSCSSRVGLACTPACLNSGIAAYESWERTQIGPAADVNY